MQIQPETWQSLKCALPGFWLFMPFYRKKVVPGLKTDNRIYHTRRQYFLLMQPKNERAYGAKFL